MYPPNYIKRLIYIIDLHFCDIYKMLQFYMQLHIVFKRTNKTVLIYKQSLTNEIIKNIIIKHETLSNKLLSSRIYYWNHLPTKRPLSK